MHRIFKSLTAICLLSVFALLSGCTTDKQKPIELSVFAAISLTDALGEIGTAFTAETGVKIYYNFEASTTLQRQLERARQRMFSSQRVRVRLSLCKPMGCLKPEVATIY